MHVFVAMSCIPPGHQFQLPQETPIKQTKLYCVHNGLSVPIGIEPASHDNAPTSVAMNVVLTDIGMRTRV